MKTRKQVDSEKTDRAAPRPPLRAIYRRLFKAFGPQHWWPAESDLEMMVGAILTQNTAWTNVEKAIRRLKEHQALDLGRLHRADLRQLADWIRPAGYFNIKARRLRALTLFLYDRFGGDIGRLFQLETGELRRALLEVKGIGPETADSIVLYAARRPVFVVDAYTRRILARHGWIGANADYDDIARLFESNLPRDTQLYNEYHALIVNVGKNLCRTQPRCGQCPLKRWLPPLAGAGPSSKSVRR